ncbi:hypothetical protein CIPAW_10G094500 [Carya illinoinensis]|uniref:Uncharacterized protein n=1 Tax=Carya illinoinensis TaxID=32201 RepID=A0A8T1PCH8_CARIL|nr:hypothetical protein CIPAW_10G094500 [Carya illinoinensis]
MEPNQLVRRGKMREILYASCLISTKLFFIQTIYKHLQCRTPPTPKQKGGGEEEEETLRSQRRTVEVLSLIFYLPGLCKRINPNPCTRYSQQNLNKTKYSFHWEKFFRISKPLIRHALP